MVSNLSVSSQRISAQKSSRQNFAAKAQQSAVLDRNYAPVPLFAHRSYAKVNFSSLLAIHKSWGAAVGKDGSVNFKLFSFADAKKVFVQIADGVKKEERCFDQGDVTPVKNAAGEIESFATSRAGSKFVELKKGESGLFEQKVEPGVAKHGQDYRFVIVKNDNTVDTVKDPYSAHQPHVLGWSKVYDHSQYQWNDKNWMEHGDKRRISRKHFTNGLVNPYTMRIYEMHIDTFTKEGTLDAAMAKLEKKVAKRGYNAIHILPQENTYSFNWGYDGVDKHAPRDPDGLKKFIDHAHSLGINVIMDMVPNHMGPDGNLLGKTGPYMKKYGNGDFGAKFDYESEDPNVRENVQQFMANAALNWAENYHCDGLRFDLTKEMDSDNAMKRIAAEVHHHNPDVFMIAEDARNNDPRVTAPLKPEEETFATEEDHAKFTAKLTNRELPQENLNNLGFDSEWDFPYQKQLAADVIGVWDGKNRDLYGLDAATRGSRHRVKYVLSHDDKGNCDGTGLIDKAFSIGKNLFSKMKGNSDCEKGQGAAHFAHRLTTTVATGLVKTLLSQEWLNMFQRSKAAVVIPRDEVEQEMQTSLRKNKLALGKLYTTQGPKMVMQGEDDADLAYFKFAREFSNPSEDPVTAAQKGYPVGRPALEDSKLDSIPYSDEYQKIRDGHEKYITKLNELSETVPALHDGEIVSTIIHDRSDVTGTYRQKGDSEVYAVANSGTVGYDGDYTIHFPSGQWKEILNSESTEFAGTGKYQNSKIVESKGDATISLPPNGIAYFEKVKPQV